MYVVHMNTNARPTEAHTTPTDLLPEWHALTIAIRDALTEAHQAGYTQGRYIHKHAGRDEALELREEKMAAQEASDAATRALWAKVYALATQAGVL